MSAAVRKSGHWLSIALVASTLLLPYVGGFPAAYLMMALSLLLLGWLAAARPRVEIGAEGWWLLVGFVLLAGVFAGNGTLAYAANFLMLALVPLLTAALRANAAQSNADLMARLSLAGVGIAAAVALYQVAVEGRPRAAGIGSDEIWSATAALTIGWLTLIGLPAARGRWRFAYLFGPALGVMVVMLSGSRGPMLAVPILFGVAFAMLRGHRRWLAVLLVAVSGLVYFWPDTSRLTSIATIGKELATGVPLTDGSFDVRKGLLDAGWAAFKMSPWTGYGWSRFAEATAPWTGRLQWVERSDAFHLHSDPLNFAVAGGVVGLAAYLAIILAPVAGAWRTPADSQRVARRLGVAILVAAYLGCGLTNTFFGFEMHTTLYACLVAMLFGFCRDRPVEDRT
jgi:O-antigen ligase